MLGFLEVFFPVTPGGHPWNHKRVHRVYCHMGLNLPRRTRKRIPDRDRQPLDLAHKVNNCWALDFMHDSLYCGKTFRTLNVIDEANRECLAIDIGMSIPSTRLIRTLERLIDYYGKPQAIRLDNGPEMTSQQFMDWAQTQDIYIRYIQPGKPNQNAFIERFNRTYRDEVLDAHLFDNIPQVQEITEHGYMNTTKTVPMKRWGISCRRNLCLG